MRGYRPALCALLMSAGCASTALPPGDRVIREVHDRYTGKRFTHVTFLQATHSANGAVELWYEAIRPLGLVRVDIAPLDAHKGFSYRADSMYVFDAGAIVRTRADERWISMLLLVDIYAQPADRTIARLRELSVDLSRSHSTTWQGRDVIVIGATQGDTTSAQAWYDREHLYPVRIIQPPHSTYPRLEFRIGGHEHLAGGWIETEIQIAIDGRVTTRECYGEIRPNVELSDDIFDPDQFATRRWAEQAYGTSPAVPVCLT